MSWMQATGWTRTKVAANDNVSTSNKNSVVTYIYPDLDEPQSPFWVAVRGANGTTGTYTLTVKGSPMTVGSGTVLIGNIQRLAGGGLVPRRYHGAVFTTGGKTAGYSLSSIEIDLATSGNSTDVEIWVHEESSGQPGTLVAQMNAPSSYVTGVNAFSAPVNTTLDADRTYLVVIHSAADNIGNTSWIVEDLGGAAGWSIRDTRFISDSRSGPYREQPHPIRLAVKGAARSGMGQQEAPQPVAPPPGLTAEFRDLPEEHDGSSRFSFEFHFSETPRGLSYRTLKGSFFSITNGTVNKAKRLVKMDNSGWRITVEPDSDADVGIGYLPTQDCADAGAVCTADGTRLSSGGTTFVPGPASLSVADASVQEGAGATLDFVVSLSRARHEATSVDYATSDGTATAGADYTAASGTLTFATGETEKTVSVAVLDDNHDEGAETMTLTLSNPVPSATAKLGDATATGTIENSDAMPRAWIARFGRTVAEQVLDAVESRMSAARTPGVAVSLAGERIGGGAALEDAEAREAEAGLRSLAAWVRGEEDEKPAAGLGSRAVTDRDLVLGSTFALTGGSRETGFAALWGRGAVSSLDGREGELTLDGEVESAMLGADWALGATTAGVIVSHSRGEGGYRSRNGGGDVESTLTGLYPWGRYAVSDRLSVWGVAGYGEGSLTLTPEGHAPMETDMDLTMAGAGLRSVLVKAPAEGGLELAAKPDGFVVRTSSERTEGLVAASAKVTCLRLALEGAWRGGALVPSVEIGVRHDGGDAETGFGADIGAGLSWSDPASGISGKLRGRGLLTHDDGGFRERGFAGSLSWDPAPSSARGPSLTLSQTLGAQASGGVDSLLSRPTMAGLAANDDKALLERRRLEAWLGYGLSAFGDRFTVTPELGFGYSVGTRDYSLGWTLVRDARGGDIGSLELSMEARRHENDNAAPGAGAAVHEVGLRLTARW